MAPSFVPSPAELALTQQVFDVADTQKLGVLTGDAAVKIFAKANLAATTLGEVWALADADNNGFLSKKGVTIALRLIAWAQKGETPSEALINKPGPVATLEGFRAPAVPSRTVGSPAPKSPPPSSLGGLPPLTPQDKAKFLKLYSGCELTNGLLAGDKARDVFVKSKLSVDQLSAVWQLADTKNRGLLDVVDFTIAMYLIQGLMANRISSLPATLPPGLYEQAGGIATHSTGASFSSPRGFPLQAQTTGQPLQVQGTGATSIRSAFGLGPVSPFSNATAAAWDISPQEKANSDLLFDQLDPQKRNYVEGDVAVPFMLQSKLPEDTLAQVWDLADLHNDGRLTRDGFAVAMHLINGKLTAGKDIPTTLPPTLIPPSMRGAGAFTSAPAAAPPLPALSQPLRDLLGDDSPPGSAFPESAGPSPFGFGRPVSPPMKPQTAGTLTSQITGSLSNQATGALSSQRTGGFQTAPNVFGSAGPFGLTAVQSPPQTPAPAKDLLGDDDEPVAASPPLEDRSAEIGNTQNQLNSTNKSLETAKTERAAAEQNITNQATQLATLQTQLSSAKASYETETRLLSTLRERYATQTADINKTREELIHAESELSALRVEKAEVEGAVLRDKEEVRDLQRKMKEAGEEVDRTKAELEKTKKDSKQQKGLLAIARKQLSARESDKAKAAKELEEATAELAATTKEREATEAALLTEPETPPAPAIVSPAAFADPLDTPSLAASHPLPVSPPSVSPQITGVSKNPFDRLTSASSSPRIQSPFLPFANVAVPTPTGQPSTADIDDPFGLSEDTPAQEPVTAPPEIAAEDQSGSSPMSPSDDAIFSTPPTSATLLPADEPFAESAARFPSIDAITTTDSTTAALDKLTKAETDLNSHVKDLEFEASDSESSDGEEETHPAEDGAADKPSEASTPIPAAAPLLNGGSTSASNLGSSITSSSFDDAFGMSSSAPTTDWTMPSAQTTSPARTASPQLEPANATKDVFGVFDSPALALDFTEPSEPAPPPAQSPSATVITTAGVNDFDETMGKLPPSASSSNFKFRSAFDDNFDFAAASDTGNVKFEPPPQTNGTHPAATVGTAFGTGAPTQTNGFGSPFTPTVNATSAASPPGGFSFDDAFNGGPATTATSAPATTAQDDSFDDAFGLGTTVSSPTDPGFGSLSSQSPHPTAAAPVSFPMSMSPPHSRPSSPATVRSNTQQSRGTSTPPRVSSPKPRPSTGSIKSENSDKPTRSSRLSIRLPFGGKNKDKKKGKGDKGDKNDAPPVPALSGSQLTPLNESDPADATPAVEDDVEAVKQLCSMGFSRSQAVDALEGSSYDVQRALNHLLGAR